MKLFVEENSLTIKLSFSEKIAVGKGSIKIHTENIISTNTNDPDFSSWNFMPESHISDMIKAGICNTSNGKELWFARGGIGNFITIVLKNESYSRIILRTKDNIIWKNQIGEIISKNQK